MDSNQPHSSITLPGAIIIAAALIAIAIIWVKKPVSVPVAANQAAQVGQLADVNMAPVVAADHILGNPNAPVKIVEYSDPSCPYCKMFNVTMEQIMTQYGPDGKVAWVYRSFPLDKPGTRSDGGILHVNAGHEAQALECAAFLGGNDKFWAFEKHFYETTPSVTGDTPNGLDQSKLPQIAKDVGLDPVAFNSCLSSGQFKDKVETQYTDGINAGVSGTPYNVIITPSGSKIPMAGAVSLATMQKTIDTLLSAGTN
jgi:protein-disulfide isomerase